jgi:hypothetical protein
VKHTAEPRAKDAADDRKSPVQNPAQKACQNLIRRALQIYVANYAGISSHKKSLLILRVSKKRAKFTYATAKNRIGNALVRHKRRLVLSRPQIQT